MKVLRAQKYRFAQSASIKPPDTRICLPPRCCLKECNLVSRSTFEATFVIAKGVLALQIFVDQ